MKRQPIARCLLVLSLVLSGLGPIAGVASTVQAAADADPSCPDCFTDFQSENRLPTPEEKAADGGAADAASTGQLIDVLIAPPRLAISGYDHAQLTALDGLFKQLTLQADETAVKQYQATGELPTTMREAVLANLNLRTLPTIDIRVIKTLNYLTTPVALGGAGQEWLRVPTIQRGAVSESGALAKDEPISENRHVTPFHYGEGFATSELDYLRSTRFLYELEIEAGHENDPVDWSRAKLVGKEKLPKQPIQVGWQTPSGASQGDALPELLTESFNGLATTLGTNRFVGDLKERLSTQGIELSDAVPLDSATVGALTTSLGTARLANEYGDGESVITNSSLYENFYRTGQAVIASDMKDVIPPWGIVGGQDSVVTAGWAVIAAKLHLTGSIDGPTSAVVLDKIAKRHLEHELRLAPTSLDRLVDGDQGSVVRAIGLGWLEARLNRDLSGLWNHSLTEFATSDPTSYLVLYEEPAITQALIELSLSEQIEAFSPADLLTRVGQQRLDTLASQYTTIDAALGLAVKSDRASGRTWFDRFLTADPADRRQIGAWIAATTLSSELSTQENLFNWFVSGVEPVGSANRPLVDTSYIEMKFELIPGDLKRIFVDNRGWEVARRSGHIGYAEGLLGQATTIATTDLKPILTGERFTEGYERVKAEAESIVRTASANLATVPNTILGTIVSALQAEVNSTNQQVTDRINGRLAREGNANQFEQFFGGLRGQVARLGSYTQYGPPELRQTLGEPINQLSIELDNLQIGSAGHQLTPPDAWRDVLNQSGSPIPHIDGDQLWQDIKGGLEGTFSFDNLIMVSGARAYGDQLFQDGEGLATNLGQYIRGIGKSFESFNPRPGAAKVTAGTVQHEALHEEEVSPAGFPSSEPTGTGPSGSTTADQPTTSPDGTGPAGASASGPKLKIDRPGIRNFIQSDLLPSVNFSEWTTEVLVTFDLATKPGYRLTTDETIDLVAGASSKVTQSVGARTIDVAYGLNVGRPFIKVLTDELTFDQALTATALDQGLGYAYHLTNQLTLENGVANAVKDIVAEEALGLAHDSLQDRQNLLERNGPDAILRLAGALPGRESNQSLTDYERAKALAYQDLLADPDRYREGLNASVTAVGGSPEATDLLVRVLKNDQLTAESTGDLDDLVGELSADRLTDLVAEMGNPSGTDDEKARFAVWQSGLYSSLMPTVDATSLSETDRAYLDERARAFVAAARSQNAAELETVATDLKRTTLGHEIGTGPDLLTPRTSRLTDRLANLGISTLDQLVDPEGIVPGGPFRTFYKTENVAESAATAAWGAIQRFVDFPPELTEALSYLGGDPLTIAKTWSDGRLNTALGLMATSQLLNATDDVGISVAVGDALMAQLGPSASDMETIQQRSRAQAEAAADSYAEQARSNLAAQPTGSIEGFTEVTIDGTVEQTTALERERVYKEQVRSQLESPQFQKVLRDRRNTAMKNVRYATLDYSATLAVRAASGSKSVTMAGFSRAMLEGTNRAKVLFLAQTLAALNENELGEYLHDGLAAYDIFSFLQQPAFEIVVVQTTTTDPDGTSRSTSAVRENRRQIPEAAFARMDSRLSELFGWQVPPGFTKAFFSFVQGNFDLTVRGGGGTLPSMNDVITSSSVQFYIGNWLDSTVGLPSGTSFTAWQIYQEFQTAHQAVAQAKTAYNLALAGVSVSGTAAGALAGTTAATGSTLAAAQALGVDPSATHTIEALTTVDPAAANVGRDGAAAAGGNTAGQAAGSELGFELGSGTANSPAISDFQVDGGALGDGLTPSTQSLVAADGGELGKLSAASQTANLQYAQITTVAIGFVVNMAFGQDFARLDSRLGMPAGTTATLVSAGIAVGVNAAFAAAGLISSFAPLAALGGPVGIALMAAAVLANALGLLGRPKKRAGTASGKRIKRVQRIISSACGVYPGFEPLAPADRSVLTAGDLVSAPPVATRLEIPSDAGAAPDPTYDLTFSRTEVELRAAGTTTATTVSLGGQAGIHSAEPSGRPVAAAPEGVTLAAAQATEATAQSFVTGNELGFPACPTAFESGTDVQFRANAPVVAQFKITTFIGNLLYLAERRGENPSADLDGWFLRPRRIQSYGEQDRFLGRLLIPRFERQIDRLYGAQSSDGHFRNAVEPLAGVGANDYWVKAIAVTW